MYILTKAYFIFELIILLTDEATKMYKKMKWCLLYNAKDIMVFKDEAKKRIKK